MITVVRIVPSRKKALGRLSVGDSLFSGDSELAFSRLCPTLKESPMPNTNLRVLIIDNDSICRSTLQDEFNKAHTQANLYECLGIDEAKTETAECTEFDLILVDLESCDPADASQLRELLLVNGHVPVVQVGKPEVLDSCDREQLGPQDFAVDHENLSGVIRKAVTFAASRQRITQDLQTKVDVLAHATCLDPTTGIGNQKAFDEALATAWKLFEAGGEESTCAKLNLDRFSRINSSFGRAAGDAILRSVAVLLAGKVRSRDLVCRGEGDEFSILLPGTTLRDGWRLAERIRKSIEEEAIRIDDQLVTVTASIGVASTNNSMAWPMDLVKATDQVLFKAKSRSNTVVTSDELAPLESVL